MFNSEVISEVLKREREKRNITQEVLSGLAGLNRVHYSNIERNTRCPNIETLFKLSFALDIKPHELIFLIEEEFNNRGENPFI